MKVSKQYLLESSRSYRKLLRKIVSKNTTPEQIQDMTTAEHHRNQFRDIIANIKKNIDSRDPYLNVYDTIKSSKSTLDKHEKMAKAIEKKYPGSGEKDDPRRIQSFSRNVPSIESSLSPQHRILSMIHPELNQKIVKTIKKMNSVSDKIPDFEGFYDLSADLARATLHMGSPGYISNPYTPKNRIKWRRYFKQ